MRHLDEGTIHAFLDGALSERDAAAVEAHLASCTACAAAAAEARGFIAASSRILSALDGVPGGVIPASESDDVESPRVATRRGWGMRYARIAAAAAFVAVGTLVVVRYGGQESGVRSVTETGGSGSERQTVSAPVPAPATAPATTGTRARDAAVPEDLRAGKKVQRAPARSAPMAPSAVQNAPAAKSASPSIAVSALPTAPAPQRAAGADAAPSAPARALVRTDSLRRANLAERTTIVARSGAVLTLETTPASASSFEQVVAGGPKPDTAVTVLAPRADGANVIRWRGVNGTVYVLSGPVSVDELRAVHDSIAR